LCVGGQDSFTGSFVQDIQEFRIAEEWAYSMGEDPNRSRGSEREVPVGMRMGAGGWGPGELW